MPRTITEVEQRATLHESEGRDCIASADEALARTEREIMAQIERPSGETELNRRWLAHYAAARRHLNSARDVLAS